MAHGQPYFIYVKRPVYLHILPPYSNLTLIKEMPYTQWGSLRVNKQGTQLAMMANNHIYVMDVDGKNFRRVTASRDGEIHADFSPDGNHLLVAKRIGPTFFDWKIGRASRGERGCQ